MGTFVPGDVLLAKLQQDETEDENGKKKKPTIIFEKTGTVPLESFEEDTQKAASTNLVSAGKISSGSGTKSGKERELEA